MSESPENWHCSNCGGWLAWDPSRLVLACASCGTTMPALALGPAPKHRFDPNNVPNSTPGHDISFTCASCGAPATISAADISGRCHFCSAPWVLTKAHGAAPLPDGIVPASIDLGAAQKAVDAWVKSRWLAPNAFKAGGETPQISFEYHPVWVFDTQTISNYTGERGVQLTRGGAFHWSPASGTVSKNFAGLGVSGTAGKGLKEAWDFSQAQQYDDACLVGAVAHAATLPLHQAWGMANATIIAEINQAIDRDIGGEAQRLSSRQTQFGPTSGSYLLAPSWAGNYLFKGKSYTIDINAETGVVSGQRPYSTIKVALVSVVTLLLVVALMVFYGVWRVSMSHG